MSSDLYSIMLVDDQAPILESLKKLVEGTGIARVVAAETDGDLAVSTAVRKKPDLILLDVSLGKTSGIDVARRLFEQWRDARVLAVSAHADPVYVRGMLGAGASGYMLKDNGPSELASAIMTIMDGGRWFGAGLSPEPA